MYYTGKYRSVISITMKCYISYDLRGQQCTERAQTAVNQEEEESCFVLFVELSVISPECLWWIWSWNGSVFEFFGVWWSFEVSQVFYLSLYEQGTCINWFLWLRWTSYDIMCLWSKRKRTGQNASEFSLLYSEQDNHYIGVQQHIGINNSTRVESKKAVRPNGNSLVSEMTGLMDDEHMSATI